MATWNAVDDFENGSDVALDGSSNGSGFDDNWGDPLKGGSSGDFKINTTQVKEGSRACQVDCSTGSAYIQRGQAAATENGALFFALRAAQTDALMYVYLTTGAGSGRTSIRIHSDGKLYVFTDAGYVEIGAYSANTWYWVELNWSGSGAKARMGTTSWGSYTTVGAITNTDIQDLQFEQTAAAGKDFWLDGFTLTDPLAGGAGAATPTPQLLTLGVG